VKVGVVLGLTWGLLGAQVSGPERRVSGNVITSEHEPAVRIELPKAAKLFGGASVRTVWNCRLRAARLGRGGCGEEGVAIVLVAV
jgi:hypothetical protein